MPVVCYVPIWILAEVVVVTCVQIARGQRGFLEQLKSSRGYWLGPESVIELLDSGTRAGTQAACNRSQPGISATQTFQT